LQCFYCHLYKYYEFFWINTSVKYKRTKLDLFCELINSDGNLMWNGGTVEQWNVGTVERWNSRKVEEIFGQ